MVRNESQLKKLALKRKNLKRYLTNRAFDDIIKTRKEKERGKENDNYINF